MNTYLIISHIFVLAAGMLVGVAYCSRHAKANNAWGDRMRVVEDRRLSLQAGRGKEWGVVASDRTLVSFDDSLAAAIDKAIYDGDEQHG